MPQVYAIVYDDKKNFLVAKKNLLGYFFHNEKFNDGRGTVYGPGKAQELNGGGLYALPGGKLKRGKTIEAGALLELEEETGLNITNDPNPYPAYHNRDSLFDGVFIKVDNIVSLHETAAYNILQAAQAVNAITHGFNVNQYNAYQTLRAQFPGCPQDNELATIEIWNINDVENWKTIEMWKDDPELGWYFNILNYFRTL